MRNYSSRFLWILLPGILSIFLLSENYVIPNATAVLAPSISITPLSGFAGNTVSISGKGFAGNSEITLTYGTSTIHISPTITTNRGQFSTSFIIPFSSPGSHSITVKDAKNNQASNTFSITPAILLSPTSGPTGTAVSISGNGFDASSNIKIKYNNTKIAFGSDRIGNYEIYTMNTDGTGQTRLTNASNADINPSFSPNGTKIAFESGRDGHTQIYIMNSNGSAQTRLTNNGGFDLSPSFSPNGTKIIYHNLGNNNTSQIYIMNTDGSAQTRLTNNIANDKHPVFSPDGTKIAFSSDRDGNDEIYIMNANGSGQTRLTNNAAIDISPTFSHDGTKIAFASNRDGNYEIYIMNTNGSGQTRLTNNAATDLAPSFSPDGAKIAFQSDRDMNDEIYTMNANGSGQTPLSNNIASETGPSFSSPSIGLTTNPGSITTNSTGGFTATFTMPSSSGGAHSVNASDTALHTGSKTFTVPLPASISLNPTVGPIDSTVTVTGAQYAASSHVTIKYDGVGVTTNPTSITSNPSGGFSATFSVPTLSTVGAHIVNASDALSHFSSRLYAVNSSAVISLNSTAGLTGGTVRVTGTHYDASSQIIIKYDGTTVTTNPAIITTNSTGGFTATFSIPSSTNGAHTVSALDAALHSSSKLFTVTGSGSGTFHMQTVLTGFNQPVKITFIPDNGYGVDGSGNAFVSQRTGDVIVMKYNATNGQFVKQSIPFVTVPHVFSTFYEEGLAGIAFPPDYNTSHFVYFYAAVQFANGTHVIQVMRYNAMTDASQNIVAVPGSQKIILEFNDQGIGHFGGHIKFDSLGNLYIGAGDQWIGGASASLQTLKGKLLRITPLATPDINGKYYSIPSTNPFSTSSDPTIMKEIFSYGLRHPYSFDLDSVTGKLYVDDVGLDTCEEIDDSTVAKNFGWGTYEGPAVGGNTQNLVNYKDPLYYYYHADVEAPGGGFVAITAGVFYNGNVYPSQYNGAYFFGDYGVGFIKALLPVESYPPTLDPATGVLRGQIVPITSGHVNNPVGLAVWHGEVYYTDYNGNIGKLTFS